VYYKDNYFKYAKELSDKKYDLLSIEKEKELLQLYTQNESPIAFNQLVQSHLRFVIYILKDFKIPDNADIMDLIQSGNYGLMIGIRRFNVEYSKGCRVSTYCAYWIRFYIMEAIRSYVDVTNDNSVEVIFNEELSTVEKNSVEKRLLVVLNKKILFTWQNHNKELYIEGVRGEEEDIKQKINNTLNSTIQNIYINRLSNKMKASFEPFSDTAEYKDEDSTIDVSLVAHRDIIDTAFKQLSPMEKLILTYYFGLDASQKPHTLQEIGSILNFTLERIRQLRDLALKKVDKNKLQELTI